MAVGVCHAAVPGQRNNCARGSRPLFWDPSPTFFLQRASMLVPDAWHVLISKQGISPWLPWGEPWQVTGPGSEMRSKPPTPTRRTPSKETGLFTPVKKNRHCLNRLNEQ
jgi:hypothetical protein